MILGAENERYLNTSPVFKKLVIFDYGDVHENKYLKSVKFWKMKLRGVVGKFKVRGDRNIDIISPAWWYMGKFRFHYRENDLLSST